MDNPPAALSMTQASKGSRSPVFFYGAFMEEAELRRRGVSSADGRKARAKGWQLSFAPAPTLTRSFCGVVWGIVYELSDDELQRLYGEPLYGLRYRPEMIELSIAGRRETALAYVAESSPSEAAQDPAAVERVRAAARAAGLPAGYVDSIGKAATP